MQSRNARCARLPGPGKGRSVWVWQGGTGYDGHRGLRLRHLSAGA